MGSAANAFLRLGPETIVGRGVTSDVHAWGEGKVLKLFHSWVPFESVEREYLITRALQGGRFPVPAVYDQVEVDARPGIVFERIHGVSLLKAVEARPWTLFASARQLAELHAQLHSLVAPAALSSHRQQIASKVAAATCFSNRERQRINEALERLPDGDSLCHGDFHPENILISKKGPVVIDWTTGTRGHPLGDVARTSVLFEVASLPSSTSLHTRLLFKCSRALLHSTYLRTYLQLRPGSHEEIRSWRLPLLAAVKAWREARMMDASGITYAPVELPL